MARPLFSTLPAPALRRWSLRTLTLAALLMALGQSVSLAGRFAAARRLAQSWRLLPRAVGTTYQGFIKALTQDSPRLLRALADHLRSQIPAVAGPHGKLGRWGVMSVDGSKFNLPRTANLLQAFGASGKRGSAPQAFLTTILHLRTGLPWDARIGRGGPRTPRRRLGGCVRDAYVRQAPKCRVRWAAKRGQAPPGLPKITAATAAQVAAAASLLHTSTTS